MEAIQERGAAEKALAREEAKDIETQSQTIREWFDGLGASGDFRIKYYRVSPRNFKGRLVAGFLGETAELLDEVQIAEQFGGGRVEVKVLRANAQGKFNYFKQRTIEISTDQFPPKLPANDDGMGEPIAKVETAESEGIVRTVVSVMADNAKDERRRADEMQRELRESGKVDDKLLHLVAEPYKVQVQALERALERMQSTLDEQRKAEREKKPDGPSHTEKILDKMIEGDSSRVSAIREQHSSELRTVRENYEGQITRIRDQQAIELQSRDRANDRAMDQLTKAQDRELKTQETAFGAQIKMLEGQVRSLERENEALKKETVELRAKRDVPFEEQVERLIKVKEAMAAFSGDGDDEEKGVIDRIIDAAGPILEGVGSRIGASPGAPPPQTGPQRMTRKQMATQPQQPQRPAQPRPVPQVRPAKSALPPPLKLNVAEAKDAVNYIEHAIRNNVTPEAFAASARSMVPQSILVYVREHGIEALLQGIGVGDEGPLSTTVGRQFLRKVAKLLGAEAPASPPAAVPPQTT